MQDPGLIRPAEVDLLVGEPRKAREQLGWSTTVDFAGLVKMMVQADLEWIERQRNKRERLP